MLGVRRRHVGVALDGQRSVVRMPNGSHPDRGRGSFWSRELNAEDLDRRRDDLSKLLAEVTAMVGEPCVFHVALVPPLAQFRIIDLPGVRESEALRIVSRDPSRFLPLGSAGVAIDLVSSRWRDASPFELVAAPLKLVEDITAAAHDAGGSLGGIVAAERAWASTASLAWWHRPATRDVVVTLERTIELVRLHGGRITSVRRVPREVSDGGDLSARLGQQGVETGPDSTVVSGVDDALELAAAGAMDAAGPVLLAEEDRALVRRRMQMGNALRFAVAATLLASAGGLELWKTARAHDRIVQERARIHATVQRALAVHESIAVVRQRLAEIADVEANAPRWSELVATLADVLPHDASLLSLTAAGDSLRIEGAALRAAPVFDALAAAPGIRAVQPQGPIHQELRAGGAASERFIVSVTLRQPNARGAVAEHAAHAGGSAP